MKVIRTKGSTSNIEQIFIADSSSTTGAGLTGLTNATSGLTAYYHRKADTTATAISLVTMTVGTFTSSGFKEIDATNMPGWYQFCPPDACYATGDCALHLKGATNMAPLPIEIEVSVLDLGTVIENQVWDATRTSHVATGTFGQGVQLVADGTAQAGASGTITLAAGSSATDNFYKGDIVYLYSGTGAGQPPNIVASYVGSTKVATMQNSWVTTPDATSKYLIIPSPFVTDPWDEARSSHTTSGTFGEGMASVQGNVTGSVNSVTGAVVLPTGTGAGQIALSSGTVTVGTNNDKTGYTASTVSDKTGYSLTTSPGIVKNTALSNFPFAMTDATTHTPKTGLTVTATRSLDGAAFASCANAVVEVANGGYKINLAAADLNANTVMLRFTATGADDVLIAIKTQA